MFAWVQISRSLLGSDVCGSHVTITVLSIESHSQSCEMVEKSRGSRCRVGPDVARVQICRKVIVFVSSRDCFWVAELHRVDAVVVSSPFIVVEPIASLHASSVPRPKSLLNIRKDPVLPRAEFARIPRRDVSNTSSTTVLLFRN